MMYLLVQMFASNHRCASVEQTKTVTFHAHDNRERENAVVEAIMHISEERLELDVSGVYGTAYLSQFDFSYPYTGIGILEVFVNGEQIPQSPIRVQITPRDCDADFHGQHKVPSAVGSCVCDSDTIQIGNDCVSSVLFFTLMAAHIVAIGIIFGIWYLGYKKRQNDQLWLINVEELHFDDPVEVIGQGSFGVVLAAEYRGTRVAIKRALPPASKTSKAPRSDGSRGSVSKDGGGSRGSVSKDNCTSAEVCSSNSRDCESSDLEAPTQKDSKPGIYSSSVIESIGNCSISMSAGVSGVGGLEFLEDISFGHKKTRLEIMFPWFFPEQKGRYKANILGDASGGGTGNKSSTTALGRVLPWCDQEYVKRQEFISEMRLLSRLRHPSITTVMGAVISPGTAPMLVMELMEYGSLHDLLRNETMQMSGEIILQICRDIAQGLRYLHASKPVILHGDLKVCRQFCRGFLFFVVIVSFVLVLNYLCNSTGQEHPHRFQISREMR